MTLILLLFLDFLLTTLGLKIILFILSCLGCVVPFSWGLAFGVWLIIKVLKLIS